LGASRRRRSTAISFATPQRIIEGIETLVRMHTAQEEDIYDAVAARTST
jgi:hypothetical protein